MIGIKLVLCRRRGAVAAEAALGLSDVEDPTQCAIRTARNRTLVAWAEVQPLNTRLVAQTALVPLVIRFVNVGLTYFAHAKYPGQNTEADFAPSLTEYSTPCAVLTV